MTDIRLSITLFHFYDLKHHEFAKICLRFSLLQLKYLVVKNDGVELDNLIEGYDATWLKESVAAAVSWSTASILIVIINLFAIDFENLLTEKIIFFVE